MDDRLANHRGTPTVSVNPVSIMKTNRTVLPVLALASTLAAPPPGRAQAPDPVTQFQQVTAEEYQALLKVYVDFVASCLDPKNLPSAAKNQRENAFGVLCLFLGASYSGAITLPVAGLAIGAGIGIPSGGIVSVPGAALALLCQC